MKADLCTESGWYIGISQTVPESGHERHHRGIWRIHAVLNGFLRFHGSEENRCLCYFALTESVHEYHNWDISLIQAILVVFFRFQCLQKNKCLYFLACYRSSDLSSISRKQFLSSILKWSGVLTKRSCTGRFRRTAASGQLLTSMPACSGAGNLVFYWWICSVIRRTQVTPWNTGNCTDNTI